MVPKRRVAPRSKEKPPPALAAVLLSFPARTTDAAPPSGTSLAAAPLAGERPTLLTPAVREWLRAALIVSLAAHVGTYLAFQLRFHDDLERATGAAAALSSQGTVIIPVDVVVEAALPSAPVPTNVASSDANTRIEIEELMPAPPDPAPVVVPKELTAVKLPAPPEPAPVTLTREQAKRPALPEEKAAPPRPAETAAVPQVPAATVVEERPPLPTVRPPVEQKQMPERREQPAKSVRSSPSTAASPSRAAAANSNGNAGAAGHAATGGSAAISSYQAQVLAHLSRHRVYPPEARERGATGIARVQFALARDGRVLSASLTGGSGERMLDNAAVDMVRRASPFPPFPDGIAQTRMDFAAPIRFDLR